MEKTQNLALKSFRGGIAPDGDKGPRGSFKFGYGLNIHGGRDTLKCNQALKLDHTTAALVTKILPTSDGAVYAFMGATVLQKKEGAWTSATVLPEAVKDATEYVSLTRGPILLIATTQKLFSIPLRDAYNGNWSALHDSGSFDETLTIRGKFKSGVNDQDGRYFMYGRGLAFVREGALHAQSRTHEAASASSITGEIAIPATSDPVTLLAFAVTTTHSITADSASEDANPMDEQGAGSKSLGFTSRVTVFERNTTPGTKSVTVNFSGSVEDRTLYLVALRGQKANESTNFSEKSDNGSIEVNREFYESAEPFPQGTTVIAILTAAFESGLPTEITDLGHQTILSQDSTATRREALMIANTEPVPAERPMEYVQGNVAIGSGNFLALYDSNDAFNPNALQLPTGLYARALRSRAVEGLDRLAIIANTKLRNRARMLTWDGESDSWLDNKSAQDTIGHALGYLEQGMVVVTGEGQLKYWNFAEVTPLRKIPDTGFSTHTCVTEHDGLTMIGMNGGTKNGLYSIGRKDKNDPIALNLEYLPSIGSLSATIGAVASDGQNVYLAWAHGGFFGIDVTDPDNKAIARYESLELDMGSADVEKLVGEIKVICEPLPENCIIDVEYRATRDGDDWKPASMGSGDEEISVADRTKGIFNSEAAGEVYEVAVTLTPNGNDTPEVKSINNRFHSLTDK